MKEEVSVLIPAHNEEKTLDFCLKSIFNQNGIKEVILVADRCTDKTIEIAKKYNVRISVKNYLRWSNPRAEAINIGINKIKGKYSFICDADIYLTKNFMERIIRSIKNPKIGVVSGICISRGLFRVPITNFFLGGCRLIRTDLLKKVKCENMIGFDTFQDLLIEKNGYKVIVNKKAIAYELRSFKITNNIKQGVRRGWAKYQTCQPLPLIFAHAIFNIIRNPFTFPKLIGTLIGYLEARLKKLPQFKVTKDIMRKRQIERIRHFISNRI